jgi:hypothetical protein
LILIEFRYPWNRGRWTSFGVTTREDWAQELLEVCRRSHPGSECRIHTEEAIIHDFADVI